MASEDTSPSDDPDASTSETPSASASTPGDRDERRSYVRVQPSTDAVSPETVRAQFERLHALDAESASPSLWDRLRSLGGGAEPPTVEFLLAADGGADATIAYYVGVDDPDLLDGVARVLRGLFPDTYELDRVTRRVDEVLPPAAARTAATSSATDDAPSDEQAAAGEQAGDPEGDQAELHVAGVEFVGRAERRRDWQTQLTAFESFQSETGTDDDAVTRVPLSAVVAAMAESAVPVVYQVLLRPKPAWSGAAETRRHDLRARRDTPAQRLYAAFVGDPHDASADRDDRQQRAPGTGARPLRGAAKRRVDEIDAKDTRHCFDVNARAVAATTDDADAPTSTHDPEEAVNRVVDELQTAFSTVGKTCYTVAGRTYHADESRLVSTTDPAAELLDAVASRTLREQQSRLRSLVPGTPTTRPTLVADPGTVPSFCIVSGAALTAASARALDVTPGERTAVPRPDPGTLARYRTRGLTLGRPLTQDDTLQRDAIALPPALQPLHVAWFGKTGSGKSKALTTALLDNHQATAGADILIDPKGDGLPVAYLRAHYARHGSLENVYYFDCTETLPAISFFDIRAQLAAGIDRASAVEDVVDHYVELLVGIMGRERFERAVRSPDIIRYLVKALFDPVHGADAFTHRRLQHAASRMHESRDPPPVTDEDLRHMLGGVATNSKRSFDELMQGVANRIEKIPVDDRLGRIFNHVPQRTPDAAAAAVDDATGDATPAEPAETDDTGESVAFTNPHFDFRAFLDEDAVLIFDTGGLRAEAQRVLALLLLSNLWTALKRRHHHATTNPDPAPDPDADTAATADADTDTDTDTDADTDAAATVSAAAPPPDPSPDLPLVNLYVEEAASIAVSDLLGDLLAQSRGFGLSVTLAMQYPGQLRAADTDAYREVLNNVSTVVTGNVPVDRDLAERLATADMPPDAVGNRLRALRRGQWIASLPADFNDPEPRPFLLASSPLPPGDPDGPNPLTGHTRERFRTAFAAMQARTAEEAGLAFDATTESAADATADAAPDDTDDAAAAESASAAAGGRVDSALPFTKRLPQPVAYDESSHALHCTRCQNRYDPSTEGMHRAIECCSSLADVDHDDIPVCEVNLKLAPAERQAADYTDRQLCFLQAVYNAQQLRYDPPAYDLLSDSMLRLREYLGIDADAVQPLIDDGRLTHDTDHPHRLYTVTPDGRDAIGESYRHGIDYGHGQGDLEETSQHVLAVEVGRRYLHHEYVQNPDSPVAEVTPYYDVSEGSLPAAAFMSPDAADADDASKGFEHHRLDLAALDDDENIIVVAEAERVNNDVNTAVPEDYDKMAACNPDEAIWIAMSHTEAHDILDALQDPPDDDPRVEKTYANSTPASEFRIDQPGLTAMYTLTQLQDHLPDSTPADP